MSTDNIDNGEFEGGDEPEIRHPFRDVNDVAFIEGDFSDDIPPIIVPHLTL